MIKQEPWWSTPEPGVGLCASWLRPLSSYLLLQLKQVKPPAADAFLTLLLLIPSIQLEHHETLIL